MSGFEVLHRDRSCRARLGLLHTVHGQVETPVFMPVGTAGAVKGISPEELERVGAEMILANTYHLVLRPGVDCIESLGGLHRFMGWNKPILTDSGGYQVFSLGRRFSEDVEDGRWKGSLSKVDDNGVEFTSHIDGAKMYLDADKATEVQNRLGGDVITCFDQCAAFGCGALELRESVERTIRWAQRCKRAHSNDRQLQFGIVQGGVDAGLRAYCCDALVKLDFDGYAIGGLSVGEGHEKMVRTVAETSELLPDSKPRYLMGVGMPADIISAVRSGIDMFDCVLPTRNGRNAYAFTEGGPLRMRNKSHARSSEPIESGCDCYCCRNFSRAAIRHFFNVGEMLGPILVSLHNLRFYQRLMAGIRRAVAEDAFEQWSAGQMAHYGQAEWLRKS